MTTSALWIDGVFEVARLLAHPMNPRTHSAEQVEQLRANIRAFGFTNPLLLDIGGQRMIAGHGRALAAQAEGLSHVPGRVRNAAHPLTEQQVLALMVADNKIALNSAWDDAKLQAILRDLDDAEFDLKVVGFSDLELFDLLPSPNGKPRERGVPIAGTDEIPALRRRAVSKLGDLWQMGEHRILCGDSTDAAAVAKLTAGAELSALLHADPPYGMGKENEGVENDNLYREKLAKFQIAWWSAWRPYLAGNASGYIWGQPEELWRLWYGGLEASERMTYRNEIVWNKETGIGMASDTHRQFPTATERCLFFMLGQQGFGNVNKDDFWEGFEPLRAYLEAEVIAAGLGAKEVRNVCGVGMYGHWFTKSQWVIIPERHYRALHEATGRKHFAKPYRELRAIYDGNLTDEGRLGVKQEFYALRAFFDNAHDVMTDVWNFGRVLGEERFGHATPKPVQMIGRIIRSSSRERDLVLEPFAGTGTTLIACQATDRRCYAMELAPQYVDVTVRRWQTMTGQRALRDDGIAFDDATRTSEALGAIAAA